jgi:hypothetical protein
MKTNPLLRWWRSATAAAFVFAATALTARSEVTAQLDRTTIALGESAQLTFTVSGGNDANALPLNVPGCEFVQIGQSSQYQSFNGVATSTTSVTYEVTPQHAGTFTIPATSPGGQPLVLHVQSSNGGAAAAGSNPGGVILPPPGNSGAAGGVTHPTQDGAAFARLRLPKHELYVGEVVPVEIQVGLRPGMVASLNGLPTLNGDAFTLNRLSSKPEQTQEIVDGQPYTVLTWHSALAVVKPGDFPLAVETPLTVQVRTAPQRRARPSGDDMDDPLLSNFFDDSFLQNFFGGTTEKEITVASEPEALKVLPLPATGRPAGFSGAVGNFEVSSEISAAESVAGDPLTLRLKVTGTGSFDRVSSGMLAELNGWKTYRPTARFAAADSVGYGGEKDFEQAVIPEHPGRQTVPSLALSYFNPATHCYQTKLTTPLTITVSPAPAGSLAGIAAPDKIADPTPANEPAKDGLRPDRVETGDTVATLLPLYFQPRFVGSQGALVLCLAVGFLFLRQREKRANDAEGARRRAAESAIAGCLAEMDAAAGSGDATRFFAAARAAFQQKLAVRWHIAPASITQADLDERPDSDHAEIRRIFALADEAAYSGQHLSTADFLQWKETVRGLLKQAEDS